MYKFVYVFIMSLFLLLGSKQMNGQEQLWKIASDYENAGNYSDAIRIKKQMAKEDFGTEWYIDDIAGIARCYSHTNEVDSTLFYGTLAIDLANQLINHSDSIAEEYIQNSAWCFYRSNFYEQGASAAERVLSLRDKMYGESSSQYIEWLGVMAYQAFTHNQLQDLVKYCKQEFDIVKNAYGIHSTLYENTISSIRGYAHQLVDSKPEFTTDWILPYYTEIHEANILPRFQYEFEILQLEGFLSMENLKSADVYAHKLDRWTYSSNLQNIPLEDRVRISLKLANHYLHMGDHYKSRFRVEEAWKYLDNAGIRPSMTQLIDRHIVERQLRMDTLGRSRINAEWIIETATPIIEAGVEDPGTIAFFYDSRAWAYGELNDYDNAISDIQNAIRLNPLYSRKKKLGQFYLEKKEYDLAENVFIELYNDPDVPDVGKRSIESDLTILYWLWGKLDKLSNFVIADYDNMKSEIRNAFAFMSEDEREHYLSHSLLGGIIKYDFYTAYSNHDSQWAVGNRYAYNMALVQKGLLLNTSREIKEILKEVPDSLKETLHLYELATANSHPSFAEIAGREYRLRLMEYVATHPNYLSQLNFSWEEVREKLKEDEAAIEFINLWGVTPEALSIGVDQWETMQKPPTPCKGVLVLRKNFDYPIFVKLSEDSLLENLILDEERKEILDVIYLRDNKSIIYNAFWAPIENYLSGVKTIYYAPTGNLQKINFDWIGNTEDDILCRRYNLYRLSSTRELIYNRPDAKSDNAILYGDIAYSLFENVVNDSPVSKYRSITRSGFSPLKSTPIELDSIKLELTKSNIPSIEFRQKFASEKSFYEMSGNSPRILHVATHGFYYTREALEEELPKGNFIAYQFRNPELYHSGLALAGAQDTWINDYDGEGINFQKYFDMDASSDGIILSSEIAELNFENTDLVVLSACETALGKITSDGIYGLQRAFKLAGVNSLIMSLWKVDDDATQLLMTSFYQNYLAGMSKREALITAQNKVKNTPGYEDPYNWAAFILLDGLN